MNRNLCISTAVVRGNNIKTTYLWCWLSQKQFFFFLNTFKVLSLTRTVNHLPVRISATASFEILDFLDNKCTVRWVSSSLPSCAYWCSSTHIQYSTTTLSWHLYSSYLTRNCLKLWRSSDRHALSTYSSTVSVWSKYLVCCFVRELISQINPLSCQSCCG